MENLAISKEVSRKPVSIDFPKEWIKDLIRKKDISENTQRVYLRSLKQVQNFLADNGIEKPNLDSMQLFKESLRNRGLSVSCANSYLIAAKSYFKFLHNKGYYQNDCHKVKTINSGISESTRTHKKGFIRFEWFQEMLAGIEDTLRGKRNKTIILLKAFSGLRDIELIRLKHSDFKYIGESYRLDIQGKGRKAKETIGCNSLVADAVIDYQKSLKETYGYNTGDPLFISLSNNSFGQTLSTGSIRGMIAKLLDKLPISPDTRAEISGHSLRHSFATWQLLAGEDIRTVQTRCRHKDSKTTEIYAHDLDQEKVWDGLETVFKTLLIKLRGQVHEQRQRAAAAPSFCIA